MSVVAPAEPPVVDQSFMDVVASAEPPVVEPSATDVVAPAEQVADAPFMSQFSIDINDSPERFAGHTGVQIERTPMVPP